MKAAGLKGMKEGQTGCEHCWYTKIVAMLKKDSPVNAAFSAVAYMRLYLLSHIVCLPSQKIFISPDDVKKMEIKVGDDKLYLGKHKICTDDFDVEPEPSCEAKEIDLGDNG